MKLLTPQQRIEIMRSLEGNAALAFSLVADALDKRVSDLVEEKKKELETAISGMNLEIKKLELKEGYTPKKFVDYFTPEEIQQIIAASKPEYGKDYLTPLEIEAMQKTVCDTVCEKVMTMIKAKDGKTPTAGQDYPTFNQVRDMVTEMFIEQENSDIDELSQNGMTLLDDIKGKFSAVNIEGADIVAKINALPLDDKHQIDFTHIKNVPPAQRGARGNRNNHGGGDTVVAGANVTITTATSGIKTISATGGSLSIASPTSGNVNGANKDFVFTTKPTLIVSDGLVYKENKGWSWNSGTSTATLLISPAYDLYAL